MNEDPLSAPRGIAHGLLIGCPTWVTIFAALGILVARC